MTIPAPVAHRILHRSLHGQPVEDAWTQSDGASQESGLPGWTSSTLVFVRDVEAAISFYVDVLGFTLNMRHSENARALVAGVSRGDGCALLLTSQWPDRAGTGIAYTALGPEEFAALRTDLTGKDAPIKSGWWGLPLLVVTDPDGNQLYFPRPA